MKILITSGGTKVPIDSVRNISNISKGTFASKIAISLMNSGHQVHFFTSTDGITPFRQTFDFYKGVGEDYAHISQLYKNFEHLFFQSEYTTFDEYRVGLKDLLINQSFDIVFCAAAVSDFLIEKKEGAKINSASEFRPRFVEAPKIISRCKEWAPETKLVGFKLLVNSSQDDMDRACNSSILKNRCDWVIGNDLSTLGSNHIIHLYSKKGYYNKFNISPTPYFFLREICNE